MTWLPEIPAPTMMTEDRAGDSMDVVLERERELCESDVGVFVLLFCCNENELLGDGAKEAGAVFI